MGDVRPQVLLLARGRELADVRALLRELELPFHEQAHAPGVLTPDLALVIGPPGLLAGRGLGRPAGEARQRPRVMAVQDWGARGELGDGDFDLLLRRPLHPATLAFALRGLLHAGPERRRDERVAFGAPIRFRAGLLRREGTLVELSLRGARIATRHGVRGGQRVTLYLAPELAGGRELALPGRAIRFQATPGLETGEQMIGVEFRDLPRVSWERLRTALEERSAELTRPPGVRDVPATPAAPEEAEASTGAPGVRTPTHEEPLPACADAEAPAPRAPAAAAEARAGGAREEPAAAVGRDADADLAGCGQASDADGGVLGTADLEVPEPAHSPAPPRSAPRAEGGAEKRRDPRRRYGRRVIALGRGATRVLLARDLSPGGMRAAPTPHFGVGDRVRIALHVRPGEQPLVVRARVARDDGEHGLVLLFESPSPPARDYLRKMLDELPAAERAAVEQRDADLGGAAGD